MTSRALTDSEVFAVHSRLRSLRDKALFTLGIRTGFRITEILSLTVNDVKGSSITVRRSNMKGKHKSRTVPMHDAVRAAIDLYLASEPNLDRLFPISRSQAWRVIRDAALEAGLEGTVSTHSMRKTFGQRVYEKTGRDVVAAQRALGHASLSSTTSYLSVGQDTIDKAILAD